MEALKKLSTPKAIVKRSGEMIEIASKELVLGDIVTIDAGRYIPLGYQNNMSFMYTLSTYVRGIDIAVGTGMETEIGKSLSMR